MSYRINNNGRKRQLFWQRIQNLGGYGTNYWKLRKSLIVILLDFHGRYFLTVHHKSSSGHKLTFTKEFDRDKASALKAVKEIMARA